MILRTFLFSFLLFLFSCSNIEFVLKKDSPLYKYKNNTSIIFKGTKEEKFSEEIFSYFGSNNQSKFILITNFSENKINRLVKKNQVAEKVDYEIIVDYEIYYKTMGCKIYNNKIITKFSFVPKSFGYNFGTDRSLDKLYKSSVGENIKRFVRLIPQENICIK